MPSFHQRSRTSGRSFVAELGDELFHDVSSRGSGQCAVEVEYDDLLLHASRVRERREIFESGG